MWKLASRKLWLTVFSMTTGMVFGWYVVFKGGDLKGAALFWAAITLSNAAFMHYNVKQKNGQGGGKTW